MEAADECRLLKTLQRLRTASYTHSALLKVRFVVRCLAQPTVSYAENKARAWRRLPRDLESQHQAAPVQNELGREHHLCSAPWQPPARLALNTGVPGQRKGSARAGALPAAERGRATRAAASRPCPSCG